MNLHGVVDDFGDEFVRRVRFSSFEDYEALDNGDSVVITKQESTESSVEPNPVLRQARELASLPCTCDGTTWCWPCVFRDAFAKLESSGL